MDTKKTNVLDRFDQIELEQLSANAEYAHNYLSQEGFDPDEISTIGSQNASKTKFMLVALANKQEDQKLLELAIQKIKEMISYNTQIATNLLQQLTLKTPHVQYRKLENWTEDEIKEVLSDINLVELMEKLSSDENK